MNQDGNTNNLIEIDPDYESTNAAIRNIELKELEDSKLTEEKLRQIIQEQFSNELQERQKQLEEIEEKIFKAQKLLHIVRYVLISSYYSNKDLQNEGDSISSLEATNILTGQNRIHPAVKKLLDGNISNLKYLTTRTKRKIPSKPDLSVNIQPELKKLKLELPIQNEPLAEHKLESMKDIKIEQEIPTQRRKIQHRVVIGNISYFKKSLEQDNLSHKWMVYVKIFRGSKGGAELSNILINKVIFYLHPSYKPHDVVEVSHPPYHLSRRGWGEFPLRVQIVFKSERNKPVDIIHNLKLNKTFTERQTVGNETVESIFLYDERFPSDISDIDTLSNYNSETYSSISTSPVIKTELLDTDIMKSTTSSEHDYCHDNINSNEILFDRLSNNDTEDNIIKEICDMKEIPSYCIRDHSYSLSYDKDGPKHSPKKHNSPVKQPYNELIYGLGLNYLDPVKSRTRKTRPKVVEKTNNCPDKNSKNIFKVLKTVTGQSINFLPESFSQILLSNHRILPVKLLNQQINSIGKPVQCKTIYNFHKSINDNKLKTPEPNCGNSFKEIIKHEKYLLKLVEHKFKNMGEALPYLYKRLPLWATEANNIEYKCTYPFTACSKREYESWNVGKKLAAEWSRAKTIKRIISKEPYGKNWTTKTLFMYGRSHLYTHIVSSYKLFQNESPERHLILNCFTNTVQNGYPISATANNEEHINITSPIKVPDSLNTHCLHSYIDISDKKLTQVCAYIKEAALDVGVVLKSEELIPGVVMNVSERIILEAVKCFAENLLRRSRNFLVCKNDFNEKTAVITTSEIGLALEERKEFQHIKKFQESKITMDFFS